MPPRKFKEVTVMSFGKELCNLSVEAQKKGAHLQDGKKVWEPIKETLRTFAKETGEKGCNIFFENIPDEVILMLQQLAENDEIELINWNSPSDAGHPGGNFDQIGVITWDSYWYFSTYPFKVSRFSLLVSKNDDNITTEIVDVGPGVAIRF